MQELKELGELGLKALERLGYVVIDDGGNVRITGLGREVLKRLKSIRYWLHSLIWPRKYRIIAQDGREAGTFEQHRNIRKILTAKYKMKIIDRCIDTRLLVAAGIVIVSLRIFY